MTITQRIQQAEADGETVTLDPSELSELNAEIDILRQDYIEAANWRDRVRLVALEARDALSAHDPGSLVARKVKDVVKGVEG